MSFQRKIGFALSSRQRMADQPQEVSESRLTGEGVRQQADCCIMLILSGELAGEETGSDRAETRFYINEDGSVRLLRQATIQSEMHFVPGLRRLVELAIPYGTLEVVLTTTDMLYTEDETGGKLNLSYQLDFLNGSQNIVDIALVYHFL